MLKKSDYEESVIKSKKSDADDSPVTIAANNEDIPRVRPKNASVFGSSLVFRGELSADEEILIQGMVEGTIAHHKKNVTVGKNGRVNALIHANSVTIHGRVNGDIHGDELVVMAEGSEVNGNIFCPRIKMDDGARFNGSIQMP